jgi:hypothetical protein
MAEVQKMQEHFSALAADGPENSAPTLHPYLQ